MVPIHLGWPEIRPLLGIFWKIHLISRHLPCFGLFWARGPIVRIRIFIRKFIKIIIRRHLCISQGNLGPRNRSFPTVYIWQLRRRYEILLETRLRTVDWYASRAHDNSFGAKIQNLNFSLKSYFFILKSYCRTGGEIYQKIIQIRQNRTSWQPWVYFSGLVQPWYLITIQKYWKFCINSLQSLVKSPRK